MPPAKFLPVQNSTWGIISQPPFIISDLLLIILTAVAVLLDQETSPCVLHWICSSYILVFLNTYLGASFCPTVSLIFKWFCPVNGLYSFPLSARFGFPFSYSLRHRQQGKLWSFPIVATKQGLPFLSGTLVMLNVQGKAGMVPAVKWTMGCCYHHTVFPSNFTGSHVCTEPSLKMVKKTLWGAYWKVCLKPFRQFRLYHPIFSFFLPACHSATMNLKDTSSEGNGKYLIICQLKKKKKD